MVALIKIAVDFGRRALAQHSDSIADAVVVGGGFAGLIAANRLAEFGRRAVVLEQGSEAAYPCNSRFTGGAFHVGFLDPVKRQPQELLTGIRARSRVAVPQLADAIAGDTRRVISWLREQGVRFARAGADEYKTWVLTPFRNNRYGLDWKGRGGDVALRTLDKALQSRAGVLHRGVRAVALDLSNSGYAVVEALEGTQTRQFRAKSVIIADGGFQANPDLVRQFIMPKPECLLQRGAATGCGDGLRMALKAGAAHVGMKRFYGHVLSKDAFVKEGLTPFPVVDPIVQAGVVVDGSAQRFVDEGEGGVWVANNIAWLPDPLSAVAIFDDAIWRGPAAEGLMAPNPNMLNGGGRIHSAGSLRELAVTVDLPADALVGTVDEYNAAFVAGTLDRMQPTRVSTYGKPMRIHQPPFHALRICAGITYTMGGIAIDEHSRALNHDSKPLERLYAAGCTTGGLEGGSSNSGYVGGLAKSGVTALRAAEHIAGHRAYSNVRSN